jgi:hypothetical protein
MRNRWPPGVGGDGLREDAGELAAADEKVVRPFDPRRQTGGPLDPLG